MARVEFKQVSFRYPGEAAFSLDIEKLLIKTGSCVAVVGPSGSGKTTLLGLMAGTLIPRSGSISVGEKNLEKLGDAALRRYRMTEIGLRQVNVFFDDRTVKTS